MRDVYEEVRSKNLDFSAVGRTIPDPFFESKEQHNLIGVANVFLDVLFHGVKLDYPVPIISQQGEVSGRLHVEIQRTSGSLDVVAMDEDEEYGEEIDSNDNQVTCKLNIRAATGLPPSLSQFVFCQYRFPGEEEITTVPPVFTPNPKATNGKLETSVNFKFDHLREVGVSVTEEMVEHCTEGALSIEVYGHR